MRQLMMVAAACLVCASSTPSLAQSVSALLKTGLSVGRSSEPQQVLIVTPFRDYRACFVIATATLIDERVQVAAETMTCSDSRANYEYAVRDAVVTDVSGELGLKAKHYPPSKQLLASVKPAKTIYSSIGDQAGLKMLRDAELGHWDVAPDTGINILFVHAPTLKRTVAITD